MANNIEIKARCWDATRQRALAAELATAGTEELDQVDTFYNVPAGRLKLRQFDGGRGELIYYQRADLAGGMMSSDYSIIQAADPEGLGRMLAAALGIRGQIRKHRTVYHAGQTRIHFDAVEGLGSFLELEVVMRADQTREEGQALAEQMMRALEIRAGDVFNPAYIDLLLAKKTKAEE